MMTLDLKYVLFFVSLSVLYAFEGIPRNITGSMNRFEVPRNPLCNAVDILIFLKPKQDTVNRGMTL
jgi:hypothetical protein